LSYRCSHLFLPKPIALMFPTSLPFICLK
jgi:hypothetical protein